MKAILLDVAPAPLPIVGWGSLILLIIIVSTLVAALVVGCVFLLSWLNRRNAHRGRPQQVAGGRSRWQQ